MDLLERFRKPATERQGAVLVGSRSLPGKGSTFAEIRFRSSS